MELTIHKKIVLSVAILVSSFSAVAHNHSNTFITTGLGSAEFDIIDNVQNVSASVDDEDYIFDIGVGMQMDNIFYTANLSFMEFDKYSVNNIYATANYEFDTNHSLRPYAGVILGIGEIEYDVSGSKPSDDDIIYGIQLGVNYDIASNDKLSLYAQYQRINYDFTTHIGPGDSFKHDVLNNATFGVRYKF
jgi:opacity protein-like surface antigen